MAYNTEVSRYWKEQAVSQAGGKCKVCGYNKHIGSLQFHHVDETTKADWMKAAGSGMWGRNKEELSKELSKCTLVCANCHREIHDGITECPPPVKIKLKYRKRVAKHGSLCMYIKYKCRCDLCRQKRSEYDRARANLKSKTGSNSNS